MQASEFDKFADEYMDAHARNLAITGADPEYFARYKIEELARLYRAERLAAPARILDFGCGIGNSLPHFGAAFPEARITALDVSERSLRIAAGRFPGLAEYKLYEGEGIPVAEGFDLIFSSCVFHHIDDAEHVNIMRLLKAALAKGGALAIFEHNPLNPVSRYIVATCPFDENAVLIPAWTLSDRLRRAGFRKVTVRYTGFLPASLRLLHFMEPWLSPVPMGAQYYTFARA